MALIFPDLVAKKKKTQGEEMYQRLDKGVGNFLAFRISAGLTDRETNQISQILEKKVREVGKVKILLVMEHYTSFNSAESLYEDLRFAKVHADHIDRVAVMGDRAWTETLVAIFGLFGGLQMAYFDRSETEKANAWLSGTGKK